MLATTIIIFIPKMEILLFFLTCNFTYFTFLYPQFHQRISKPTSFTILRPSIYVSPYILHFFLFSDLVCFIYFDMHLIDFIVCFCSHSLHVISWAERKSHISIITSSSSTLRALVISKMNIYPTSPEILWKQYSLSLPFTSPLPQISSHIRNAS